MVQWNSLNQVEKIQKFGLEISTYRMLPRDWTDGELPFSLADLSRLETLRNDPALLYSASHSSKTSTSFKVWFRWYMLSIGISYSRLPFVPFWLPARFLCIANGQDVISLARHDHLSSI
jgi:hypothetical protein